MSIVPVNLRTGSITRSDFESIFSKYANKNKDADSEGNFLDQKEVALAQRDLLKQRREIEQKRWKEGTKGFTQMTSLLSKQMGPMGDVLVQTLGGSATFKENNSTKDYDEQLAAIDKKLTALHLVGKQENFAKINEGKGIRESDIKTLAEADDDGRDSVINTDDFKKLFGDDYRKNVANTADYGDDTLEAVRVKSGEATTAKGDSLDLKDLLPALMPKDMQPFLALLGIDLEGSSSVDIDSKDQANKKPNMMSLLIKLMMSQNQGGGQSQGQGQGPYGYQPPPNPYNPYGGGGGYGGGFPF